MKGTRRCLLDSAHGVREFVVGTGGGDRRFSEPAASAAGSESAAGYEFRLVGEDGEILDQGSDSCHGRPGG